jgi:demethylmenaquinone methyltransferase/2-methoxy-6-polyprenyl-1,4-benzoquinol methylase
VKSLLDEQIAFYRAVAEEYFEHAIDVTGGSALEAAVAAAGPTGDVLELACGPGTWTGLLARTATTLTAVDSSPEMLALAKRRAPGARFIEADLFAWEPDRRYDAVFFGFFLSHVPEERFDDFWARVGRALKPGGRVLFADDGYITDDERAYGEGERIRRTTKDGRGFDIVKVAYAPAALEARLRALGWDVAVRAEGEFYWGEGTAFSQEPPRERADTGRDEH